MSSGSLGRTNDGDLVAENQLLKQLLEFAQRDAGYADDLRARLVAQTHLTETAVADAQSWDRRHTVAHERALAAEAVLAAIRQLVEEIHGHGADTLEGEMWRLRGILNRIDAVLGDETGGVQ